MGMEEIYSFAHRINLTAVDPTVGKMEIKECMLIQNEH